MRGNQGRVAFIWPSDGLNDDEFLAYLPDDVAWLVNRFPGTLEGHSLDFDTFKSSAELQPMVNAAHMMRSVKPNVVALGDHAGSFINGMAFEIEQRQALLDACGATHATTVSIALIRALKHLDLTQVTVCSPYTKDVTNKGIEFIEQHKIKVAAIECLALPDEHAINTLTLSHWHDALRRIDRPESDAIVIFGGGLRLAQSLNELQTSIGKKVIPATTALVWDVCRLLGIESLKHCAGCLKSTIDKPSPIPLPSISKSGHLHSNRTLAPQMSTATKIFALSDSPPLFVSAHDSILVDHSGKQFLDFACGSGTTALGHGHPVVTQAIQDQLNTGILHIGPHFHTNSQLALIDRLVQVLPDTLNVIHPATNGTEATEAAIKAAMHATGKKRFISFEGSYHGRTLGALALSHAQGSNATLGSLFPDALFLPYPVHENNHTRDDVATQLRLSEFEQKLEHYLSQADIAGVIIETVQATAGMRQADPQHLHVLREFTRRHQVPLIFDEVFTGFGRTGSLFHFEQLGITPDMLILGKAVGGGIPGALLAGPSSILRDWSPGTQSSTFQMHPLAAATSLATLDELLRLAPWNRVKMIGQRLSNALQPCMSNSFNVASIEGIGAMWGVEINNSNGNADQPLTRRMRQLALYEGLITWECGLHGNVIGLVPPLTISDENIDRAVGILHEAIKVTESSGPDTQATKPV